MSKSPDAFRTISEVADWLDTQAHVLRFWESKFSQVKPIKRAGGRRYYRPQDMLLLGGIKTLLHDEGLTIKGAQKLLREKGVKHVSSLSQPLDPDDVDEVSTPLADKQANHLSTHRPLLNEERKPAATTIVAPEKPQEDEHIAAILTQVSLDEVAQQAIPTEAEAPQPETLSKNTTPVDVISETVVPLASGDPETSLEEPEFIEAAAEATPADEPVESPEENVPDGEPSPVLSSDPHDDESMSAAVAAPPSTPDLFAQAAEADDGLTSENPEDTSEVAEVATEEEDAVASETVEPIEEFLIRMSKSSHIEVSNLAEAAKLVSQLDAFCARAQETDRA